VRRLETRGEVPLDALAAAAGIVRRVIEDYHEKLEEEHLFPRFEKARGSLRPRRPVPLHAGLRRRSQLTAAARPGSSMGSLRRTVWLRPAASTVMV
jgi:hypothetical protein